MPSLEPAAIRYAEITRRSDLARTPIQFADMARGAMAGAEAAGSLAQEAEKRKKAEQFQQLLNSGLPGMQQIQSQLPEGHFLKTVDARLFSDTPDNMVNFYKMAAEGLSRAEVGGMVGAGDYEGAAGASITGGLVKDPTGLVGHGLEAQAKADAERTKKAEEAKKVDAFAAWQQQANAQIKGKGGKLKPEDATLIAGTLPPELSGYKPAEDFINNLKLQPSPIAAAHIGLKESQDLRRRVRLVKKDLDPKVKIAQAYADLDKIMPGGVYGEGEVPGFGLGTKPFRKWFMSDAGANLRAAVAKVTNITLKDRSGAAVTENELDRIQEELALTTTSTVDAFRQALQRQAQGLADEMANDEETDPEAFEALVGQGYRSREHYLGFIGKPRAGRGGGGAAAGPSDADLIDRALGASQPAKATPRGKGAPAPAKARTDADLLDEMLKGGAR